VSKVGITIKLVFMGFLLISPLPVVGCGNLAEPTLYFSVQEINRVINQVINGRINTVVSVRIFWIMAVPTQTWDAPHDLSKPHYINLDVNISLYTTYVTMFF
jgi:hypothetical protein